MTNEITKKQDNEIQQQSPVMQLADKLASGQINADQMEKMLEVQMKWEANEARKVFNESISDFKANPPKIIKNKLVSYKQTKYRHATLESIMAEIEKPLSEYGLNVSWRTETLDTGAIKVTCRITHKLGHYEETSLPAMPDITGSKNAIQAIGSAVTYLQRYTLKSALGLVEADQDDDGNAAGEKTTFTMPTPNAKQEELLDLICEKLPKKDGKVINRERVKAAIIARWNKYPTLPESVQPAAEHVMKICPDDKLYIDDTRSEFEQDYNL